MKTLIRSIETAISAHQTIDIVYMGGSKPGAVRRIMPLSVKENILKAKAVESGAMKSFKLDLITQVSDVPEDQPFRNYTSLHDLLLLESSLILLSDLYLEADPFHIALYKTDADKAHSLPPLVSISRNKFESRKMYPWVCKGRPYQSFQKAAEEFVRTVRAYIKTSEKEHQL